MSSNNHPERFPTDAEFAARNSRVASLIHKFKVEVRSFESAVRGHTGSWSRVQALVERIVLSYEKAAPQVQHDCVELLNHPHSGTR